MDIRIENRAPQSPIHIIWGGMALFAIAAARLIKPYLGILPVCTFHRLLGIPCPTCGGTRSLAALSGLNIGDSFFYNPLLMSGVFGLIFFSLAYCIGIIFKKRALIAFSTIEKRLIRYTIIFTIIANWAFLIFYKKL
jgi:hypothetical protein